MKIQHKDIDNFKKQTMREIEMKAIAEAFANKSNDTREPQYFAHQLKGVSDKTPLSFKALDIGDEEQLIIIIIRWRDWIIIIAF